MQDVFDKFEAKLIGKDGLDNRYRLGYFWAEGGMAFGRGMGKIALLRHLQNKIYSDWSASYFVGRYPVCALYVAPPPSIKDKPVEYTCQLAIRNLQSF